VSRPRDVFVHRWGLCESTSIGAGTKIWAFAHVMNGARVGADCNICDHVFIEAGAIVGDRVTIKNAVLLWDKVIVEDDVFVGPNAVFTNDLVPRGGFRKDSALFLPTVVRRGATIGANATIVCGVTIGELAFVGAGAVVTTDVPTHALVVGNPARRVGWVCSCGRRIRQDWVCSCGRMFEPDGARGLRERTDTEHLDVEPWDVRVARREPAS